MSGNQATFRSSRMFLRRGLPGLQPIQVTASRPLAAVGEGGGVLLVCLVWGVSLVIFTEILSWFSKSERKFYMIYFEDCVGNGLKCRLGSLFPGGACHPLILQVGESLPVASGALAGLGLQLHLPIPLSQRGALPRGCRWPHCSCAAQHSRP